MSLDTNRRIRIKWPFAKAMINFMKSRPAYIPLLSAPRTYKRDLVARTLCYSIPRKTARDDAGGRIPRSACGAANSERDELSLRRCEQS